MLETKQGADEKRTRGRAEAEAGPRQTRLARVGGHDGRRRSNQAESYAKNLEAAEPPPPFLIVADVGHCFDLFADFSGTGRLYRPFPDAGSNRDPPRPARRRGDARDSSRRVWTDPLALDPARRQARVTVELAKTLAELAQELDGATDAEGEPMDAEAVAGFLSRALFSMFAEDAGLSPRAPSRALLEQLRRRPRRTCPCALSALLRHDGPRRVRRRGAGARLRRFNGLAVQGHAARRALARAPATGSIDAAHADWADVEPSIFGTLLERALDPTERHRLGAHFTPRAYVERLVGPTILEPLRDEWAGRAGGGGGARGAGRDGDDAGARTRARNEAAARAGGVPRAALVASACSTRRAARATSST